MNLYNKAAGYANVAITLALTGSPGKAATTVSNTSR